MMYSKSLLLHPLDLFKGLFRILLKRDRTLVNSGKWSINVFVRLSKSSLGFRLAYRKDLSVPLQVLSTRPNSPSTRLNQSCTTYQHC